jgi:hypothetical protein
VRIYFFKNHNYYELCSENILITLKCLYLFIASLIKELITPVCFSESLSCKYKN